MCPGPSEYDEDYQMYVHGPAIADATSQGATYNQTDINNQLTTKLNAVLAALRHANIIEKD